jgi:hypothetical protein
MDEAEFAALRPLSEAEDKLKKNRRTRMYQMELSWMRSAEGFFKKGNAA